MYCIKAKAIRTDDEWLFTMQYLCIIFMPVAQLLQYQVS